jgi:hypothetical protein
VAARVIGRCFWIAYALRVRNQYQVGGAASHAHHLPFCHEEKPKKAPLSQNLPNIPISVVEFIMHAKHLGRGGCFPKMMPCAVLFVESIQAAKDEERRDRRAFQVIELFPSLQGLFEQATSLTSVGDCKACRGWRVGCRNFKTGLDQDEGTEYQDETIRFFGVAHFHLEKLNLCPVQDRQGRVELRDKRLSAFFDQVRIQKAWRARRRHRVAILSWLVSLNHLPLWTLRVDLCSAAFGAFLLRNRVVRAIQSSLATVAAWQVAITPDLNNMTSVDSCLNISPLILKTTEYLPFDSGIGHKPVSLEQTLIRIGTVCTGLVLRSNERIILVLRKCAKGGMVTIVGLLEDPATVRIGGRGRYLPAPCLTNSHASIQSYRITKS